MSQPADPRIATIREWMRLNHRQLDEELGSSKPTTEKYQETLAALNALAAELAAALKQEAWLEEQWGKDCERLIATREALRVVASVAHDDPNVTGDASYDWGGVHGYEPGEPRGCPVCVALDAALAGSVAQT